MATASGGGPAETVLRTGAAIAAALTVWGIYTICSLAPGPHRLAAVFAVVGP
jgi:hypothetical protein